MKKLTYVILGWCLGKKQFFRFFLILKNVGLEGMNYRNTNLRTNGELFLMRKLAVYYKDTAQLVLFDVGANIGNYAKALAETFKERATIYSFEPFSAAYLKLKTLSQGYSMIKPQRLGLSDEEKELPVFSSEDFSETGGVYDRSVAMKDVRFDKKEINQFKTIDRFCLKSKITRIHFLKIDVEGHELAVLKGATNLLENNLVDFIQFEFGSGNHFSKTYFLDFFELLSPHYTLYRLLKNGLVKISAYNSDMEMQVLANFVAIHKKYEPEFLAC